METQSLNGVMILSLLLVSVYLPPIVQACSCFFTPLKDLDCSDFDLVLVGTVVSSSSSPSPSPSPSPLLFTDLAASPTSGDSLPLTVNPDFIPAIDFTLPTTKIISIQLDECVKDINNVLPSTGSTMSFITSTSSASCGITLPIGETYILFVSSATDQPFPINICSTKYLLSSGVLPIIKSKCGACNGCVKPNPLPLSPIFTASPIVASPVQLPQSFTSMPTGASSPVGASFLPDLTASLCLNPCLFNTCPFFPNADCVSSCGCKADFLNLNGLVTDQCTCPDSPECLPSPCTISQAPTTTPTSFSDCQTVECPFDFTPLCQFIPYAKCVDVPCNNAVNCFVDPCQVTPCPRNPSATCISNYCGGCNAIFVDPATNEATKCDFADLGGCEDLAEFEFSFGPCDAVLGYAKVNGICKAISGCSDYGFEFFQTQEDCEAECGCGVEACEIDPCSVECPNFPNAVCTPDYCECTATFSAGEPSMEVTPLCETCTNFEDPAAFFGECDFPLGIAVVQGECTFVSGCQSFGFPFFQTPEECQECVCQGVDSDDFFGPCKAILGVTVVNGECQVVDGCGQMDKIFFDSIEDCISQCTICSGVFGDADNNNIANVQDVVILIGVITGSDDEEDFPCIFDNADTNNDSQITIQDIIQVIECISANIC